jgi:hypothetical protein
LIGGERVKPEPLFHEDREKEKPWNVPVLVIFCKLGLAHVSL